MSSINKNLSGNHAAQNMSNIHSFKDSKSVILLAKNFEIMKAIIVAGLKLTGVAGLN